MLKRRSEGFKLACLVAIIGGAGWVTSGIAAPPQPPTILEATQPDELALRQAAEPPDDRGELQRLEDLDRLAAPEPTAPGQPEQRRVELPPPHPSLLFGPVTPIDLPTALRLAGVQNPELMVARQLVFEAEALRTLAAAQILPTLNPGMNYDLHTGVLQQSNGNILSVNRAAVYVGAGSNAVAAGTVNVPGVLLSGNIAQGIYDYLVARQVVNQRGFDNIAVRNQVFLEVAVSFSELTRAEAFRAVALQARDQATEIARLTADYAASGEGRLADANRAATELARWETEVQKSEGQVLAASARLARAINVDPSVRLHPTDAVLVPMGIVPDSSPVQALLAIALVQRPELAAQRAAIRQSLLSLEGAKVLPFSPTVLLGFSAGGFGGGSNLVRPVFGAFGGRTDFDMVAFWSIRNMGVGNLALIRLADAHLRTTQFQQLAVLNQVREQVAEAYALTHARFAQIGTNERAILTGQRAFQEDYTRIKARGAERQREVLPIELLDSFRLLSTARLRYVDAIAEYNEAQFQLFVAMGQPPAAALAHRVPIGGVFPPSLPEPPPQPLPAQPQPNPVVPEAGMPGGVPALPASAALPAGPPTRSEGSPRPRTIPVTAPPRVSVRPPARDAS